MCLADYRDQEKKRTSNHTQVVQDLEVKEYLEMV
jgi:hypothetical protein